MSTADKIPNDHHEFTTKQDIYSLKADMHDLLNNHARGIKQEFKIILFEFAEKHRLETLALKVNFMLFILSIFCTGLVGYIFKFIFEIFPK